MRLLSTMVHHISVHNSRIAIPGKEHSLVKLRSYGKLKVTGNVANTGPYQQLVH
jgi:hypothetical protein